MVKGKNPKQLRPFFGAQKSCPSRSSGHGAYGSDPPCLLTNFARMLQTAIVYAAYYRSPNELRA